MNFEVLFHVKERQLPSLEAQFYDLWKFAKELGNVGLGLDKWYAAAPTEKESLAHKAFNSAGPTGEAIRLAHSNNRGEPDFPSVGVWNGIEDNGGAVLKSSLILNGICSVEFNSDGILEHRGYNVVADMVEQAIKLWPATCVKVGPFNYYLDEMQVFPERPGVGWMLYLPHEIAHNQVPEAQMLRYVTDVNGHKGTIVISEIDGIFDADNPAHVHTANKIEIRLADRGLLPKYADL